LEPYSPKYYVIGLDQLLPIGSNPTDEWKDGCKDREKDGRMDRKKKKKKKKKKQKSETGGVQLGRLFSGDQEVTS
jgi:hypothetical protein